MNDATIFDDEKRIPLKLPGRREDTARRLGLIILVLILVTTGSMIRVRPVAESDTADWLVILQSSLCVIAGLVGVVLIRKHSAGAVAARLLLVYIAAVIVTAVFSSYFSLVVGYWALLAGTSVLCIGLISSSADESSLERVEFVIFAALAVMVLKDTILSVFVLEPIDLEDGIHRIGDNTTSSNALGILAAMAFCMSFRSSASTKRSRYLRYAWRALFLSVILLTRSRVSLLGLLGGMLIRFWFARRRSTHPRIPVLIAAIPCWIGTVVLLGAIGWVLNVPPVTAMVDLVNRNEDSDTLMSVTGRTEIWPYAIQRIFESAQSILLGHGYGVSKFVLNENNWSASFFAYHSHNTFLEAWLGTGLLGAIPFLLLLAYGTAWVFRFSDLRKSFSMDFTLRAIAVLTLILSSIFTESELVTKINPVAIVFFFYVLALDRRRAFGRICEQ
jgi:O-antigen ligase